MASLSRLIRYFELKIQTIYLLLREDKAKAALLEVEQLMREFSIDDARDK